MGRPRRPAPSLRADHGNTDGVDPDSCDSVHVSDVVIDVGDDAVSANEHELSSSLAHFSAVSQSPCLAWECLGSLERAQSTAFQNSATRARYKFNTAPAGF